MKIPIRCSCGREWEEEEVPLGPDWWSACSVCLLQRTARAIACNYVNLPLIVGGTNTLCALGDAIDAWRKAEAEWPREGVVRWVDVTAKELLEGESDG